MTNESASNEPFFKAQDALREIILDKTGRRPSFKSLRFASESTRLEYLQILAERAGLRLSYETFLRGILDFDHAELFRGTMAEHAEAILQSCALIRQASELPQRKTSLMPEFA